MIALPFSTREFFEVFGRYNVAVWPAQLFLYGVAALVIANVIERERPRFVLVLLAVLWLWMGIVYHLVFFAAVNPAARVFGTAFILEAGILMWAARRPAARSPVAVSPFAALAGKALVAYALLGYPLIGYLAGHRYPETPTFGAPCPTTIFTLGILLWARRDLPRWVMVIPVIWTIIGTSAAVQLGVPQDYGLTVAGLASLIVLVRGSRPIALGMSAMPRLKVPSR